MANKTGEAAFGALILILLTAVAVFALNTFLVMIILGALHGSVSASVPALGYGASAIVTLALGVVRSFFRSHK